MLACSPGKHCLLSVGALACHRERVSVLMSAAAVSLCVCGAFTYQTLCTLSTLCSYQQYIQCVCCDTNLLIVSHRYSTAAVRFLDGSMWQSPCDITVHIHMGSTEELSHAYIVSACALPANVLRLHKQHASRTRSRLFMATPKNLTSVSSEKQILSWWSSLTSFFSPSFLFPVQSSVTLQRNFCFAQFGLLLSVSQAGLANCFLLQLHSQGGEGVCQCSPPLSPQSVWTRLHSAHESLLLLYTYFCGQGTRRRSSRKVCEGRIWLIFHWRIV